MILARTSHLTFNRIGQYTDRFTDAVLHFPSHSATGHLYGEKSTGAVKLSKLNLEMTCSNPDIASMSGEISLLLSIGGPIVHGVTFLLLYVFTNLERKFSPIVTTFLCA